jgi:hypothetical protein
LKWIVELEKPLTPALSPEYRGEGEMPTIQRQHISSLLNFGRARLLPSRNSHKIWKTPDLSVVSPPDGIF